MNLLYGPPLSNHSTIDYIPDNVLDECMIFNIIIYLK